MWWSGSASTDYYSVIAGAASQLPTNTVEARQELYDRARAALARQLEQDPARIKRERRTLEKAIRQLESRAALNIKQLNRTEYEAPSTVLLIASIFFLKGLWALDCTIMSTYWVVARLPRNPEASSRSPLNMATPLPCLVNRKESTVSESRWKTWAFANSSMKLSWRTFMVGALCGTIVMAVGGATWLRWKPVPALAWSNPDPIVPSAQDENAYDECLITRSGNKVVCDAFMRVLHRSRQRESNMKEIAKSSLAAGFSKCEVVKWGYANGFVGSQMSEAVGMSIYDLSKC
jgi:hypothetical protein